MKLKSGKIIRIDEIYRSGRGPSDVVRWEITSSKELDDDEIFEIIEEEYPSAGYGMSSFKKTITGTIEVTSNASCD